MPQAPSLHCFAGVLCEFLPPRLVRDVHPGQRGPEQPLEAERGKRASQTQGLLQRGRQRQAQDRAPAVECVDEGHLRPQWRTLIE